MSEKEVLSIKGWNNYFEVSQSRRVSSGKPLTWVAMPTKQDGKGYRRLIRIASDRAPSVFGVWCAMVQLSAKMPVRGVFRDEDGPLTCEDISDATGFDLESIEYAVSICKDKRIGWLCGKIESSLGADSEHGESMVYPQDRTVQDITVQDKTLKSAVCGAPTIEEVKAHCKANAPYVNPNKFFWHYDPMGWKNKNGVDILKTWKRLATDWNEKEVRSGASIYVEPHPKKRKMNVASQLKQNERGDDRMIICK